MTILVSTLMGAVLGLFAGLLPPAGGSRLVLASAGAIGALISAIILSGLMINPSALSGAISAAAVARALLGAALLLGLVTLLMPGRRSLFR